MNIKEFLKDYSSGKSIDMFSKEFINIANKIQETEKLLWQYNNTFKIYLNKKVKGVIPITGEPLLFHLEESLVQ